MTAQKGRDLLLKVDSDDVGTFITVAGLRSRGVSLNAEPVDVTNAESIGRWRELLAGSGVRRASITGSGLFKDDASDTLVRQFFFEDNIRDWQIIMPDFGTLEGPFQIITLEYAGEYDGAVTYDLTLESAGALAFVKTAEPEDKVKAKSK